MSEEDYESGYATAMSSVLSFAARELGHESDLASNAHLIAERERAIVALRRICEEHGDTDWDSNLNLVDILEKHLECYFEPHMSSAKILEEKSELQEKMNELIRDFDDASKRMVKLDMENIRLRTKVMELEEKLG